MSGLATFSGYLVLNVSHLLISCRRYRVPALRRMKIMTWCIIATGRCWIALCRTIKTWPRNWRWKFKVFRPW